MKHIPLLISLTFFIVFISCDKQNINPNVDLTKPYFVEFDSDLAGYQSFQDYEPDVSMSKYELTNTFYSENQDTVLWIKIREDAPITENILLGWVNRNFEVSPLGSCTYDPPGSNFAIQYGSDTLKTVPGGQSLSNFQIKGVYYKETNYLGKKVYNIEGSFNLVVKNLSLGKAWNITNGNFCIQVSI